MAGRQPCRRVKSSPAKGLILSVDSSFLWSINSANVVGQVCVVLDSTTNAVVSSGEGKGMIRVLFESRLRSGGGKISRPGERDREGLMRSRCTQQGDARETLLQKVQRTVPEQIRWAMEHRQFLRSAVQPDIGGRADDPICLHDQHCDGSHKPERSMMLILHSAAWHAVPADGPTLQPPRH